MLQENFTAKLLELLRTGELDCAIMAEPFPDTGLAIAPLYDEPFMVAVPKTHPLAKRKAISADELKQRDDAAARHRPLLSRPRARGLPRVRAFSPADAEGIRKSFEGSSLETIKYMVASGMGVTVVPQLSVPAEDAGAHRLRAVHQAGADAPRRARVAAQLHALRGDRGAAQRDLRLRAEGRDAAVVAPGLSRRSPKSNARGRRRR